MKKSFLILTVFAGLLFGSCQKEKNDLKANGFRDEIANFETSDELFKEIEQLRSMSLEELKAYEDLNGYISFGRYCDELYLSINVDSINNDNQIVSLVDKNSEFLEIVERDGEKYLETKLANNPYKYVMNKDNLFQCGKRIYKVYEDALVSVDISNKSKLMSYNPIDFKNEVSNDIFQISLFEEEFITKDVANNCGASMSSSQTNGSERTNIGTSLSFFNGDDANIGRFTQLMSDSYVRPYKKTLGIWYYCNRTISCSFQLAIDRLTNAGWVRSFKNYSNAGNHGPVLWYSTVETISFGGWSNPSVHYGGSQSWGDTPSTSSAVINCNTFLF